MSGDDLAPCPFCGGKADFECVEGPTVDAKSWTVGCNERDADDDSVICYGYQSFTTFPTRKMAAEAWNRRAIVPPPAGQVDERVREMVQELNDCAKWFADEQNGAVKPERTTYGKAAALLESTAAWLAEADAMLEEMLPRYEHDCNFCHGVRTVCAQVPRGGCLLLDERWKRHAARASRAGTGPEEQK